MLKRCACENPSGFFQPAPYQGIKEEFATTMLLIMQCYRKIYFLGEFYDIGHTLLPASRFSDPTGTPIMLSRRSRTAFFESWNSSLDMAVRDWLRALRTITRQPCTDMRARPSVSLTNNASSRAFSSDAVSNSFSSKNPHSISIHFLICSTVGQRADTASGKLSNPELNAAKYALCDA